MAPVYRIFDGDHPLPGVYLNWLEADGHKDQLQRDAHLLGYENLKAEEVCFTHDDYKIDSCPFHDSADIEALHRVKKGLQRL